VGGNLDPGERTEKRVFWGEQKSGKEGSLAATTGSFRQRGEKKSCPGLTSDACRELHGRSKGVVEKGNKAEGKGERKEEISINGLVRGTGKPKFRERGS